MSSIDDDIKILNLEENFKNLSKEDQEKELAIAWRKFSLKWHPDRNKSPEAEVIFKMGNNANDNIKEYIEKGYFASENSANEEYSTSYEDTTDDTNEDVDCDNADETYHDTNTGYNSYRGGYYWDKYYNSDNEKELFFESSMPLKIILTAFIIAITIFFVKNFNSVETKPETQQHIAQNNISDKSLQKLSSDNQTSDKKEKEIDFSPYMNELTRRINLNWDKPNISGDYKTVLLLKIAKDGRLLSCRVQKSSGLRAFDNAAINAVELTAPFRPLPPEYKGFEIDIEFVFEIGNNSQNKVKNSTSTQNIENKKYKAPVPSNGSWTPNPSLVPVGGT